MVAIMAVSGVSSAPSPTPDELAESTNDVLPFRLNAKTDRALTTIVNTFITKKIIKMPSTNNATVVQTKITNKLQVAYGNQIDWLVDVTQDYKPPKENVSINYFGEGITSNVTIGVWTIYWAATPVASNDTEQPIFVDRDAIKSQLSRCSLGAKGSFTAAMVSKCLENSLTPVTSGRNPIAKFIFISSSQGPNTSVENSPRLGASSGCIVITIRVGSIVVKIVIK